MLNNNYQLSDIDKLMATEVSEVKSCASYSQNNKKSFYISIRQIEIVFFFDFVKYKDTKTVITMDFVLFCEPQGTYFGLHIQYLLFLPKTITSHFFCTRKFECLKLFCIQIVCEIL